MRVHRQPEGWNYEFLKRAPLLGETVKRVTRESKRKLKVVSVTFARDGDERGIVNALTILLGEDGRCHPAQSDPGVAGGR